MRCCYCNLQRFYYQDEEKPERSVEYDIEMSASLAAMMTLQEVGVTGVSIKWLNDVYIRGHKVLGALCEYKGLISGTFYGNF